AGSRPAMKGCEDGGGDEAGSDRVGPRPEGSRGRPIGPSELVGRARHRRAHRAHAAGAASIGSGLAENTGGSHDEARVARAQVRVSESQVIENSGGEALQGHVGPFAQAKNDLASLGFAQVKRDASFAGV